MRSVFESNTLVRTARKICNNCMLFMAIVLLLTSCGSSTGTTWQEQYDLGMQYLTEGDYEAAIVAFTTAIEIEPNETDIYLARAEAYVMYNDSDEYLSYAVTDYEMVLSIDATVVDAYLGLANVYVMLEDYDSAVAILRDGLEATENSQSILDKLNELLALYDNESVETDTTESDLFATYSIKEFTSRENYRDFEEFSEDEQNFIITLVSAAETGDMDTAWEMMDTDVFVESARIYSMWNDYKIEIKTQTSSTDVDRYIVEFTIRPENDVGYCILMDSNTNVDFNIMYISCPCEAWQWNGAYYEKKNLLYTAEVYYIITTTGNMVNGLREGTFNRVKQIAFGWNNYENWKISEEETEFYKDGYQVNESTGEVIDSRIWGLWASYDAYSQYTIDYLYW